MQNLVSVRKINVVFFIRALVKCNNSGSVCVKVIEECEVFSSYQPCQLTNVGVH